MNNEWERRADETFPAYVAFREYLALRSCTKVAQKLYKSRTLIGRWSGQYNWVERARAYDNALFEEVRDEIKARYIELIRRQWADNSQIAKDAGAKLINKLDKASLKTLNEIYHAAFAENMEILDRVTEAGGESETKITIERVPAPVLEDEYKNQ